MMKPHFARVEFSPKLVVKGMLNRNGGGIIHRLAFSFFSFFAEGDFLSFLAEAERSLFLADLSFVHLSYHFANS